ncbi:MAG TPA: hypothetical protein VMX76_02405 [Nevskiaceae bacterium]|nr:hypothetical protein [Nevskiaceae bacterium]
MTEQGETIESPLLWQELTPEEASQAVFVGYSHFVNNNLAPLEAACFYDLSDVQTENHDKLITSLCPNDLSLQEASLELDQKSAEEAVRLTAQWLKKEIEEKTRRKLEPPLDEKKPVQFWLKQAKKFYSFKEFSSEDREAMEKVLRNIRVIWENLEVLADPKKQIRPDVKLDTDGEIVFDFREKLTLPH